ncbi:hypothetical protein F4808DRAFT_429239 [Astrocystis sublimbata]|nr:hypothetical protein F4808DRAFT_429239 [Astrocystis sublimbata]
MPPKKKFQQKKKTGPKEPVDENDYLETAGDHEEAMMKHRAGDPVKAMRFADRAIDAYTDGLRKFPRSSDLAYNKARLELFKANDPLLSGALKVPALGVLREALRSHDYARDVDPTHADTLFNMAQVLTSIAEIIASNEETGDSEALRNLEQALDLQGRCFELQQAEFVKNRITFDMAMGETAEDPTMQLDSEPVTMDSTADTQSVDQEEEQWAAIEEPVTSETLLDTLGAQFGPLTVACSILSSSQASSPEWHHITDNARSWISSHSDNLLHRTLPALIEETRSLGPDISGVMLRRAVFISHFSDIAFRHSTIDVNKYAENIVTAFTYPGIAANDEDVLMDRSVALCALNSTLRELVASGGIDAGTAASHASVRWKVLGDALSHLRSLAGLKDIEKDTVAKSHSLRGDISLSMQILAYSPVSHSQAQNTTAQVLQNAQIYYRNASKLFGSLGGEFDDERLTCEFKDAVVGILLQLTTSGSSSGQGGSTATPASPEQIQQALGPLLRQKGESWIRDRVGEVIDEGLVMPSVFSALS